MSYSYFAAALQGCGVVILAGIFFIYFILTNKFFGNHIIRYFVAAAAATVLLAAADCCQSYYATLSYPTVQRVFFAAAGYSLRVAVLYFVLMLMFRDGKKSTQNIIRVLMYLNVAVSFSAFFTDKAFYFTAENQLVRGPLIFVPFLVSAFYFLMLILYGFANLKKGNRQELTVALLVFISATIATFLEVYFETRGLLTNVIIVGLVFYYMNFMSFNYSYDRLTGAYIRNKMYEDAALAGQKSYGIITLDMNDLKKVNDTYGHQAGDKALMTMSRAVMECLPSNTKFYRIGGDEFVIFVRGGEEEPVKNLASDIRRATAECGFPAAVGWCVRQEDETLEKAMARADEWMYTNKAQLKNNV